MESSEMLQAVCAMYKSADVVSPTEVVEEVKHLLVVIEDDDHVLV